MVDPVPIGRADYLVVESTYGNRRHDKRDPAEALAEIVGTTIARGGTVIIPAFAVGRAQSVLFHLHQLKSKGRLPNLPIFLDSPMATDASEIFCRSVEDHKLSEAECRRACAVAHYIRSVEELKALTANPLPKVIISASGMATGGRVLHHLKRYAPDPKNTILFAGFQAGGTRGAAMMAGADSIKIHGEYVPVRAEVKNLDMLSAHADADEILRWLHGFKAPPANDFHDAWRARRIRCAAPSDRGGAGLALHGSRSWSKGRALMSGQTKRVSVAHGGIATNSVRARRLGLDTQYEAIVFMHKECDVCRSEGFRRARAGLAAQWEAPGHRHACIKSTGDLIAHDEAALSESAWTRLGLTDGARITVTHPAPLDSLSHVRSRIYGHDLGESSFHAIITRHRGRQIFRHSSVVVSHRLRRPAARSQGNPRADPRDGGGG